jgi:type II secretory ATPase GspE/PulE/Tfp pilus assembly ATPase PilB-like protein
MSGTFKIKQPGQTTLFKATLVPINYGEKFIIQVMPQTHKLFNLYELGLADEQLFTLQKYLDKKTGIILISGPKNSGTTATVYSLLSQLNLPQLNIITLEDQIEHNFKHFSQIAPNPRWGQDFASTWRAIKNQDADIIYLSRLDKNIPIHELALTASGKLIIASLETDDSLSALVDFFLNAPDKNSLIDSLGIIINQRLAKGICPHCKQACKLSRQELRNLEEKFDLDNAQELADLPFYQGTGCAHCDYTGEANIIPLFEIIEVDQALTDSLQKHGLNWKTKKLLEERPSIYEAGLTKALAGQISINEIFRVF